MNTYFKQGSIFSFTSLSLILSTSHQWADYDFKWATYLSTAKERSILALMRTRKAEMVKQTSIELVYWGQTRKAISLNATSLIHRSLQNHTTIELTS